MENVIKWLEVNQLDYWRVMVKDAENSLVFESTDGAVFADNVKRFRDVMDLSTGGRFIIKAGSKKGVNRGNYFEEFKNISESSSVNGMQQQPSIQGFTAEYVQEKVDAAIGRLETKMLIEKLEAEKKELREELNAIKTPVNQFFAQLSPYVGKLAPVLINKIFPTTQVALAGIEPDPDFEPIEDEAENSELKTQNSEQTTELSDEQTRLMVALDKWSKADPDFLTLIEAVADMAARKDPMYNMAKGMLK
ncbi:MAG: hypothetical protein QM800_12710 [Paludibacter sp.]